LRIGPAHFEPEASNHSLYLIKLYKLQLS